MKKKFTLIIFIILLIACTGCKKNNNLDLEELYEQNIELASDYFFGWGTDVIKYEFIIFEPENATIYERSKFGECFSDDVEKILYVKYELSTVSPYVVAIQYKSVEQANESWLLDHSFYMQYENIVAARISGSYLLLYGEYMEIDGYWLSHNGEALLYDNKLTERIDIVIPQGVKYVTSFGLASDIIKTVKCNSELEVICGEAFAYMSSLEKIEFNDGLKEIGALCFNFFHNLDYVIIPKSVEIIEYQAFENVTIYCEVEEKPVGWDKDFAENNCEVYWKGTWEYVDGIPQPIANEEVA